METASKIKKTVIFIGYECNNNCRFCMEQDDRRKRGQSKDEILRHIVNSKKSGSTYLEIIGGEATIRPEFIEIIRFAKKVNFETIMIATNGRLFSYKDQAYKAIEAGINSIVFSIHGHTPELHDYLTRVPGSFKQLHQGLKNIKEAAEYYKKDVLIGTNTTIVKPNYKHIYEIGKHINNLELKNSEFIFVDCNEGGAYNDFYELVPRVSEAAPYIKKCLDLIDTRKNTQSNWDIRYVPLCYFPNHLNQISEIREVKIFKTGQLGRGDAKTNKYDYQENRKNKQRIKPEKCKKCVLYDYCEGLWRNYYKNYGDEELTPLSRITKKQQEKLNLVKNE